MQARECEQRSCNGALRENEACRGIHPSPVRHDCWLVSIRGNLYRSSNGKAQLIKNGRENNRQGRVSR